MIPIPLLLIAGALGLLAAKRSGPPPPPMPDDPAPDPAPVPDPITESDAVPRTKDFDEFQRAYASTPYHAMIADAEGRYSLPQNVLARLLWQESRFNPAAVNDASGALGIAQFMPETAQEWKVDPMNPESAIPGAAKYLRWLYRQTGDWQEAIAAYNWGIGNVQREGIESAPDETVAYYQAIYADSEAE